MTQRRLVLFLALVALAPLPGAAAGAAADEPESAADAGGDDDAEEAEGDEEEAEEGDLRERLTEREDQRRPVKPWSTLIGGRPLTVSGEYGIESGYLRHYVLGEEAEQPDRALLESALEVEVFYSFGRELSLFAQVQAVLEEDLLSHTVDGVSDLFVERGEMWLYSENIAGTHLNLDVGRLDFEDDRRWWWDDELDAVRLGYERDTFEVTLALARELASDRSDRTWIDPDDDRVLRWIGEASWDWRPNHAFELFLLHQDDRSALEQPGDVVSSEREDDADGRLTWLGARATGAASLPSGGLLGYWLDAAFVRGRERQVEYEEVRPGRSEVEEARRRDVSGWAVDAGISWMLPVAFEPRLFGGLAVGSGDTDPDSGTDHSFQQTQLEANEAGFGGVERFAQYGVVLDPELSNLGVLTLGAGVTLFRSSSLDLVYHAYRLLEPADEFRDSRLEATLDGRHRDAGQGVDVVLALEEWERIEFLFIAGTFRAGSAFGRDRGTWSYGGVASMKIAF
jgi:alginate production protein